MASGEKSKLRKTLNVLIAVLAVIEGVLLVAFFKTDIATSWPLGDWPGSEWKTDFPAAFFWFFFICFMILICFRLKNWRPSLFNWALLLCLVYKYIYCQLSIVSHPHRLIFVGGILIVATALCSTSELVLAGDVQKLNREVNSWAKNVSSGYKKVITAGWIEEFFNFLLGEDPDRKLAAINSLIGFANTLLAVGITVLIASALGNDPSPARLYFDFPLLRRLSLPWPGSDGFVLVGVTAMIFVFGETIPKQYAMAYKQDALSNIGWWVYCLYKVGFPARLFVTALVEPIHSGFQTLYNRKPRRP